MHRIHDRSRASKRLFPTYKKLFMQTSLKTTPGNLGNRSKALLKAMMVSIPSEQNPKLHRMPSSLQDCAVHFRSAGVTKGTRSCKFVYRKELFLFTSKRCSAHSCPLRGSGMEWVTLKQRTSHRHVPAHQKVQQFRDAADWQSRIASTQ